MPDEDKSLEQLEQELNADASQDENAGQDLGIESDPDAPDTDTPDPGEQQVDYKALQEELEAARKEKQKIELERNMLRNKQLKAERERLESVNKDEIEELRSAYETLLAERQQREQEEEERESRQQANAFRDSLISKRPETVQKAARALIEKNETNLAWKDANSEEDAANQINAQLDALESVLGVTRPEPERPVIHGNNPGRTPQDKKFEDMSLEEMEKSLPWADPR